MVTHAAAFPRRWTLLSLLALLVCASCNVKPTAEWQKEFFDRQVAEVEAGNSDSIQLYDMENTDTLLHSVVGLGGVKWLVLSQTNVTNAGIADVATLPDLTRLTFHSLRIKDEWLEILSSCPRLDELELCPRNHPVTFHISKALALPHLRKLRLSIYVYRGDDEGDATRQTADSVLADLEQATSLEELELDGLSFENRKPALIALQQKLPNCKISLLSRVANKEVSIPVTSFDEL